jgi:hypothetical protein
MKNTWTLYIFILSVCLPIIVSCGARKFDFAGSSEDKGYIRFVADTENIPDNYHGSPQFNVTFYDPSEKKERKAYLFASLPKNYGDVIIAVPPGSYSFFLQPFLKGKKFDVPVNVVKDHIVTVKCYIIIIDSDSYSNSTYEYSLYTKTTKTTTTTKITYRFKSVIEPAKPYQL